LSRWLDKGVKKGDTYFTNNRFTTISDVKNSENLIQKYSPLTGRDFTTTLAALTKGRLNGSAAGPSPAGLNG
jgi:hypothetical protein